MNIFSKIKSLFSLSSNGASKNGQHLQQKSECVGTVKYFNYSRGYGFIDSKAFDRRVFLHISDLEDRVNKGQRLRFEVEKTHKGLRAKNVEITGA